MQVKIDWAQVKTDWAIVHFLICYQNLTRENIHSNRLFANTNLFLTLSIYVLLPMKPKLSYIHTYVLCTYSIMQKVDFAIGM